MTQRILWVFGSLGTVLVIAAVLVRLTTPEQLTLWWWLAASGLALLVIYVLLQWRDIVAIFHRRQARYGTLATASLLLGLMIVVSVNYVLARQNKRWDLTAAKQHSLSPQTIRVLESLDSPIRVIVFAQEFDFGRYRNRLGEYEYASSQVSIDYVDVDKNPALARAYEVQSYGTVVFEYNDRVERVVSDQEQDLTNALIKVVEGEELKVYFLQGHGERSPENTERDGYMRLAEALQLDNLAVERLPLSQTGSVPTDADVIVVAGPSTDLLPGEIDLLRTYLEEGGKALFLIDPPVGPDAIEPDLLISLIAEWGIEVGQDVVVDVSGLGQLLGTSVTVPVATTYPPHGITDRFELLTAFPLTRSIRPIESGASNNRVAQTVVETSQASWSETNLAALDSGEVELNEAEGDLAGPISIAAAISIPIETEMPATNSDNESDEASEDSSNQETRIAVFGDSDFAANSTIGIQGNQDLALNSINWLAQQENLISIRPREPEDRRITLTADEQFRIQLILLLIIPGLILGAGVYTRWRSQ